MISITAPTGEILLAEIPEDAYDIKGGTNCVGFRSDTFVGLQDTNGWFHAYEELGFARKYKILGTLSHDGKIDFEPEESWVEWKLSRGTGLSWTNYRDIGRSYCNSAKSSFISLLQSHIKPDDAGKRFVCLMKEKESTNE